MNKLISGYMMEKRIEVIMLVAGEFLGLVILLKGIGLFGDGSFLLALEGSILVALTLMITKHHFRKSPIVIVAIMLNILVIWYHFLSDMGLLGLQLLEKPLFVIVPVLAVYIFVLFMVFCVDFFQDLSSDYPYVPEASETTTQNLALAIVIIFGILIAVSGAGTIGAFLPWVIGEGLLIIILAITTVFLKRPFLAALTFVCMIWSFLTLLSETGFLSGVPNEWGIVPTVSSFVLFSITIFMWGSVYKAYLKPAWMK
jgi:hypothetical protein